MGYSYSPLTVTEPDPNAGPCTSCLGLSFILPPMSMLVKVGMRQNNAGRSFLFSITLFDFFKIDVYILTLGSELIFDLS